MLRWISDTDLRGICEEIISNTRARTSDEISFKNGVDPFSALFDLAVNNIPFEDWLRNEHIRQKQKTLQNHIGTFHQRILGKIRGWEDLGTGQIIDLVNRDKRIIAEVKNKHNTVKKSSLKKDVFDPLARALKTPYRGFTAYYVTVLAQRRINKPFTPSDNETGRPAENPKIREIDGASFYEIATGSKTALADLYHRLPEILADVADIRAEEITASRWFAKLFELAIK